MALVELYDEKAPIFIYREGLCYISVCTEKESSPEEIEKFVNRGNQGNYWKISKREFSSGETNPCVCNRDPNRIHYLLEC